MSAKIVEAALGDVPAILEFIRELARFENLEHEVVATEESLRESLFGPRKYAEVVFVEEKGERVGFALFFHNYSTFLGKPGLYLEDVYVRREARGRGYGKLLMSHLARVALAHGCGRLECGRSTGMRVRSTSTVRLAPSGCRTGPCTDCRARR